MFECQTNDGFILLKIKHPLHIMMFEVIISDGDVVLRNDLFYINHFSLIIFYHSVWLDFELFGLRAQVHGQLVQFTLASKVYDNHHYHNKPPDRKWGGVWMTSCPEEMLLRI